MTKSVFLTNKNARSCQLYYTKRQHFMLIVRLQRMYASVRQFQPRPAPPPPLPPTPFQAITGHFPALQPRGWGISKFCATRGSGICQPRGQHRNFWNSRSFQSEYNYTEDFTGKTSRLAHLSGRGKNYRGLLRHVFVFMHVFLHWVSSQNYIAKSEPKLSAKINVFSLIE